MIDTVIFDIGNVLADFDWKGWLYGILNGSSEEEKRKRDRVQDALRGHGLWDEFDRGVMSDEEIISGFISYAPDCEREIRLLCENIGGCMRRRDIAAPWIRSVKNAGRRALYLSNYSRLIMRANPDVLDFLPLLDGGVFSCDVHLIKPDPAIYVCLCEKYNLTPSSCVFIDDMERNVAAARGLGMKTVLFESYEQARSDVEALLRP